MKALVGIVVVVLIVCLGVAFAANQFTVVITNRAVIRAVGIGVYEDPDCTKPLTSIDWGVLDPGSSVHRTIYLKNLSNVAVVLALSTENWQPPEAATYIGLSWDYDGREFSPGEKLSVVLTLTISSEISGIFSFSFDIIITATG